MRHAMLLVGTTVAAAAVLAGCAGFGGPLPAGTVQKGSLANEKLAQDARLGVAGKAGSLGCARVDAVDPYVVDLPSGTPGARVWNERWMVTCAGKTYPIDIVFSEVGSTTAHYAIK